MPQSPIDFVMLGIVFAALALIVRGMARGTVGTCDPGGCGGTCARCKRPCARLELTLSDAQRAELRAIDERAREMGAP